VLGEQVAGYGSPADKQAKYLAILPEGEDLPVMTFTTPTFLVFLAVVYLAYWSCAGSVRTAFSWRAA
jgi:hypothetical protein